MEENKTEEMPRSVEDAIRDAKAEVYDLMIAYEQIQKRIAEVNNRIADMVSRGRVNPA